MSQQGANFFGTFGPFDDSANSIPGGRSVTISVQARDITGNTSTIRTTVVQLNECV